jgi:hypothetical protein
MEYILRIKLLPTKFIIALDNLCPLLSPLLNTSMDLGVYLIAGIPGADDNDIYHCVQSNDSLI